MSEDRDEELEKEIHKDNRKTYYQIMVQSYMDAGSSLTKYYISLPVAVVGFLGYMLVENQINYLSLSFILLSTISLSICIFSALSDFNKDKEFIRSIINEDEEKINLVGVELSQSETLQKRTFTLGMILALVTCLIISITKQQEESMKDKKLIGQESSSPAEANAGGAQHLKPTKPTKPIKPTEQKKSK